MRNKLSWGVTIGINETVYTSYINIYTPKGICAQHYDLGFGGGGSLFHGDVGAVALNAEGIRGIFPNQPLGTITLRRQFNWHWSTRFNFSRGYLGSNDSWAKDDFKRQRAIDLEQKLMNLL